MAGKLVDADLHCRGRLDHSRTSLRKVRHVRVREGDLAEELHRVHAAEVEQHARRVAGRGGHLRGEEVVPIDNRAAIVDPLLPRLKVSMNSEDTSSGGAIFGLGVSV